MHKTVRCSIILSLVTNHNNSALWCKKTVQFERAKFITSVGRSVRKCSTWLCKNKGVLVILSNLCIYLFMSFQPHINILSIGGKKILFWNFSLWKMFVKSVYILTIGVPNDLKTKSTFIQGSLTFDRLINSMYKQIEPNKISCTYKWNLCLKNIHDVAFYTLISRTKGYKRSLFSIKAIWKHNTKWKAGLCSNKYSYSIYFSITVCIFSTVEAKCHNCIHF